MGSDLMKKILMMLVLAPVMAMAGEPAAVTNACDTSRDPRPVGAFRRSGLQQGPRPIVNGYNWSYSVSRFGATIGTLGNLRGKSAEPAASPTPTGHVTIPSTLDGHNVTCIGDRAFRNCGELTSVTLPEGVTTIGQFAFENCGKLTSVTIPKGVARIGGKAFAGCAQIKHIEVDADNSHFISIDGVVYTKNRKEVVVCPSGLSSVKIPDGVTNIGVGAFSGCGGLTALELPNSVTIR